jgi:hypothetical protein
LPNELGVVNSQFWYRDVEDHIDRIDVSSSEDKLESARGNIGDGKRYGLNLDVSTKLDPLGLNNALLTTGVRLRDSEFMDPFLVSSDVSAVMAAGRPMWVSVMTCLHAA